MRAKNICVLPLLLGVFFVMTTTQGYSQKFVIPDSLKNKTLDEIENLYITFRKDSIKKNIYGRSLLQRAKQENNDLGLAKGYRLVSFLYNNDAPIRIAYLDSSIAIGKKIKRNDYPEISYSNLAWVYFQMGNYDESLELFLQALKYANQTNNKKFYYISKHNIALIKTKVGEQEEAIKIFKEVNQHNIDYKSTDWDRVITFLTLANAYRKVNKLDSATFYNKKGYLLAKEKELELYNFLSLNEGINLFYKQNYQVALDSILTGITYVENEKVIDKEFLISGYLHLSKLYKKFKNPKKTLEYLKKIDHFHNSTNFTSIEIRQGYELLIRHYKSKKDKNKQLHYIDKLLTIDSILDYRYKNLNKRITKEFDTPNLLKAKEAIIADLESEKNASTKQIFFITGLLVLSLGGVGYYYYNQRRYKKRFLQLVNTTRSLPPAPVKNKASTQISQEKIDHLLAQLQKFEAQQDFLTSNINTKDLAKRFGSNSSYLSIVVNTYKEKSFSRYISDLRIDYAVAQLQANPKFRKYTIKAIAQEIGFNNAEAFAKAFYKKTGIYPSYFIKNLEA